MIDVRYNSEMEAEKKLRQRAASARYRARHPERSKESQRRFSQRSRAENSRLTAIEAFLNDPQRFWSRLAKNNISGCWEWSGPLFRGTGYAMVSLARGKLARGNRVAWELTYGPIPDGLFICHRCDNPRCCNPEHLFVGSPSDNTQDSVIKGRHAPPRFLSDNDAVAIFGDPRPQKTVAAEYGVSPTLIRLIKQGKARQRALRMGGVLV